MLGKVSPEIQAELGLGDVDVISVAEHDTASAVVATPATEDDFIFISCGTWSLFGTELQEPVISEKEPGVQHHKRGRLPVHHPFPQKHHRLVADSGRPDGSIAVRVRSTATMTWKSTQWHPSPSSISLTPTHRILSHPAIFRNAFAPTAVQPAGRAADRR